MMRVLKVSAFAAAYSGLVWASLLFACDRLGYGVWSIPMAAVLGGGLLVMLVRAVSLLVFALQRPVAPDPPHRLRADSRHNIAAAAALGGALFVPLCTLVCRYEPLGGLRRWETGLLGLLVAYLLVVAAVAVLDAMAGLANRRALAYLAATDPEGWLFASDGMAALRRQARQRMGRLGRVALGCGVFVLLYGGGSYGLGLRPASSLVAAALASAVTMALTVSHAASGPPAPSETFELAPCAVDDAHEWEGARCRRCGARRRRREGQPV